ncbi:MAG: glycosyltransferase family 2 protein [Alphaproteobacteria bacterium]|nr:glycosyltransferase family 2 protein [Alphaproteobacteria bacterium]
MLKKLAIILPCYNEEEILPHTIRKMRALIRGMIKKKKISADSKICFVNDGSRDDTWNIIKKTCAKDKLFCAVNLSRNFGHQGAILAGMYEVCADVYVTIDADLQDNPDCIPQMLEKINSGCDIVYGVRDSRQTDSFFKRTTAVLYYRLLKFLGVNIVYNHADFRMMTKRAVETLKQFPERNLFLRAIVPLLGFKSAQVYYDRTARQAGETKYPLKKMVALAWNGVSNFSIVPLRLVTFLGFFVCFLSVLFLCFVIYRWSVRGTIVGWASMVTIITVFSGVQLVSLGIIGEYLAKIFVEVKKRPLFIVEDKIGFEQAC